MYKIRILINFYPKKGKFRIAFIKEKLVMGIATSQFGKHQSGFPDAILLLGH